MVIVTYEATISNVGAEVGDFKLGTIDCGVGKGIIKSIRVQATTAPDTSFEIAMWRKNRVGVFDPEHVDCIYWREDIDTGRDWCTEDDIDHFYTLDVSLSNKLLVGIRAVTAGVNDTYSIQVDIEPDKKGY